MHKFLVFDTRFSVDDRYQGHTVADVAGKKHLVVYGGIHESAASDSLQMLDLSAKTWFTPTAAGTPPRESMGSSAAFIPPRSGDNTSHVLFIGGADGNDLLRDGDDFFGNVLVLAITADAAAPHGMSLTWHHPAPSGEMHPQIGGRCHAMCNFGGRLVCFGGGSDISNTVAWLDCKPTGPQSPPDDADYQEDDEAAARRACGLELTWGQPKDVEGAKPRPRLSHAAVRAGRHMLVFGGWSQGELNDVQVLDMADSAGGADAERIWGGPEHAATCEELICAFSSDGVDGGAAMDDDESSEEEGGWGGGYGNYGGGEGGQLVQLPDGRVIPRALLMQLLQEHQAGGKHTRPSPPRHAFNGYL